MKLPGLIDVHVHLREPGATHKEDWDSGTAAALAGGVTLVLAMPNTQPAVTDTATLELTLDAARRKARCDFAQYLGAGPENLEEAADLAPRVAGLKLYLDQTYGDLRLDRFELWRNHLARWPRRWPLAVHAEGASLAAAILLASLEDRPVHLCHVSRRSEIELIRDAKAKGIPITCEVAPHHLLLTAEDGEALGPGRCEVRPRLGSEEDRRALWENLATIDCFATDHAPHRPEEKDGPGPPPGFPGLETALPLLLTEVHRGRLTLDELVDRFHRNPRRIFGLPEQPDTFVEVDAHSEWVLPQAGPHGRCGWSPFAGRPVRGMVERVVLRGQEVFREGRVLAEPGSGRDVRSGEDGSR